MSRAESATNGTAPNAVNAMSKLLSENGRAQASAWTSGTRTPERSARATAWRNMPADRSTATGSALLDASHAEHDAEPQPTSRIRFPATGPRIPASLSRRPSGHQTKSTSPRKAPWRAW
jgi:hypothetical protein